MRLNKLLAARLNVSRRYADIIIASGRVTIANQPAQLGTEIDNENLVKVDGKSLPKQPNLIYLLINKPTNYVCSRNGQGSKTIYELIPKAYWHLKPVGRLDKDSSGLLLMTNDGEYHNKLTHPSFKKEKMYLVSLDKKLKEIDKESIASGITLSDGVSKFNLFRKDEQLEVHMQEGRNRQIRRTFKALGYEVTSLHRIKFGSYNLDSLAVGSWKLDIKK